MRILRARVTSKGQVTLPKRLRQSLGIHEGDHVEFAVESGQKASVRRLKTPGSSSGVMKHLAKRKPVSIEEMDEAICSAAVGNHAR
jgi:antitoxin PrlF